MQSDNVERLQLVVQVMGNSLLATALFALGLFLYLWLMPYIPFAVQALANDPNRNRPKDVKRRSYQPSSFGFFTTLQPGQVKIIERGKRFKRCIMRYDNHMFIGERAGEGIRQNSEKYWEVVETEGAGNEDSYPIHLPDNANFLQRLLHAWSKNVYEVTGYVFTGLYPFQTVRVYPMDRYNLIHSDDGSVTTEVQEDFSDHYRVEDFQFPVAVRKADTKDKIPVDIVLNFIGRVENAYEVAYATDNDWSARLMSDISNAAMSWTRHTALDSVLSAKNATDGLRLKRAVLSVDSRKRTEDGTEEGIESYGLAAIDASIIDISPSKFDNEITNKLGDLAIARIDREAAKQRAKGEAAGVGEFAAAAAKHGRLGSRALEVQGKINTAKAAGQNAIVIIGDNSGKPDPILAALLREQKKGNKE